MGSKLIFHSRPASVTLPGSASETCGSFIRNLIIFVALYYCSTGLETSQCVSPDLYYVSGKGSEKECTLNDSGSPCTLPTALKKIHKCAILILVDNPFILSDEIVLSSAYSDITIAGAEKGVFIHCRQKYGGFIYDGCTKCGLKDLHFVGCQVNISSLVNENATGLRLNLSSNRSTIFIFNSTNFEISNCIFYSCLNSAILLVDVIGTTTIKYSSFIGNKSCLTKQYSRSGGIVMRHTPGHAYNSTVQIISCHFDGNTNINPNFSAPFCLNENGGAIDVIVSASEIRVFILIIGSNFSNNSACGGGAVAVSFYGEDLIFDMVINNSQFNHNTGFYKGGAIVFSFYEVNISDVNKQNFSGKRKSYGKFLIQSCTFYGNYASWSGALAAYYVPCNKCENNMDIEISDTEWVHNRADLSGFAVGLSGEPNQWDHYNITVNFTGNCLFQRNSNRGDYGSLGAISIESATVRFIGGGVTTFDSNAGTALLLRSSSEAIFDGTVIFSNNNGVTGGAVLVQSESRVLIKPGTKLTFVNNSALVYGGAFYSDVNNPVECVIEFDSGVFPNNTNVTFVNNTIHGLNQSVFIQASKPCQDCAVTVLDIFKFVPQDHFQMVFPPDEVKLEVLPKPLHGDITEIILGESFYFNPILISDIFNKSSNGIGNMYYNQKGNSDKILVIQGPKTINFDNFTQHINYSVTGPEVTSATNISIFFFFFKQSSYHVGSTTVEISVVPCRQGYVYSDVEQKCICVGSEEVHCLQDSRQLCLKYHYWYSENTTSVYSCPMIYCQYMNKQCPPNTRECLNSSDYCNIKNPSDVCWEGRAGVLCSECIEGMSYTLGALKCVDTMNTCKFKNTVLLIMAVLLYWTLYAAVLLVVLSLRLSVGSGFMYGLIYYFSVVTIYTNASAIFGDPWVFYVVTICEALTQLKCFNLIAHLMPYCFSSSWTTPLPHIFLQYAGPVFVIALMLIAILFSRFCRLPKKLRLSRSSPIHAICLLVLFSYTSISSTNFQLLIPIKIENQQRIQSAPSVSYFSPTHVPYAIVAIFVELTISLPICFLLLFSPCISKHIDLVKYKLKPIVDEFHACYRTEYRWFAGFYFLARQLVYLINGLFSETEPQGNSLLVVLNVLIWTIHTTCQPYQKRWLNVLDTIFLTDLVLISSSMASESFDLKNPLNVFIHRRVLPYVLILLPLCYLCGTIVFICGQKLKIGRLLSYLWGKFHRAKQSLTGSEGNQTSAQAKWDDSYYGDDGVREPLLDESFQPDSSKSSKYIHYDSVEDTDRSHTQSTQNSTSSSVRVSHMNSFPPTND